MRTLEERVNAEAALIHARYCLPRMIIKNRYTISMEQAWTSAEAEKAYNNLIEIRNYLAAIRHEREKEYADSIRHIASG